MHSLNEQRKPSCGDTWLYHPPSFSPSSAGSLSLLVLSFGSSSNFFIYTVLPVAGSNDRYTHSTSPTALSLSNSAISSTQLTLLGLYFTCKHQVPLKHK
jgi:hypothetical protein